MMLVVIATITVKPGMVNIFTTVFSELAEGSRKEAGCISFQLFRGLQNGELFYMVEEWESETAIQQHMNSQHYQQAMAGVGEMLLNEPEINICTLVL